MPQDKRYIAGSFYRRDDRSGFKVRSFDMTKEWNGLWIRNDQWEKRQSQDFVRGQMDPQNVEEPRPTATPGVLGPLTTTTTAAAAAGTTSLTVELTTRMSTNDVVQVLVGGTLAPDAEVQFQTTIASVVDATHLTLASPLPGPVSSGSLVTDITASAVVSAADFPASNGNGPF